MNLPRCGVPSRLWASALFLFGLMVLAPRTEAGSMLPPGFVDEEAFPAATFDQPVKIVFLPDGRKLVVELPGRVWTILPSGLKWQTPFIDLTDEVRSHHDLGMIACAIDPDFTENKWVYLGYVVDPGNPPDDDDQFCRVTRYKFSTQSPNIADPSTREVLIGETWTEGFPTLTFSHAIGSIRFAEDKTMLVGAGDGGQFAWVDPGGYDPNAFGPGKTDPAEDVGAFRARSLNSIAGSILRVDKETGLGLPSNPYWDGDPSSDRSRIWAYGFRNPYRFSIRPETGSPDPADGDPGVLYVGDVGWSNFEEFDIVREGGLNFGWPCYEGFNTQNQYQLVTATEAGNDSILCSSDLNSENPAPPTPPVFWWHHTQGNQSFPVGWSGSTAVGGVFYTGTSYPPEYHGTYFLGDYLGGWIRRIEVDENDNVIGWSDFLSEGEGPVDIEADPATGDLYYISIFRHEVRRIRYEGSSTVEEGVHSVVKTRGYPNPFHDSTTIELTLSREDQVWVQIYSASGQLVRTLARGRFPEGRHSVEWDGTDDAGLRVSRGVYFYQAQAGDAVHCRKVVLQ